VSLNGDTRVSTAQTQASYVRLVLTKGTSVVMDGQRFRRATRMLSIEGLPGMVFAGCLVEMKVNSSPVFYLRLLSPLQVEKFKSAYPGYKVYEKEDHGEACVIIDWNQYWYLINGNKM